MTYPSNKCHGMSIYMAKKIHWCYGVSHDHKTTNHHFIAARLLGLYGSDRHFMLPQLIHIAQTLHQDDKKKKIVMHILYNFSCALTDRKFSLIQCLRCYRWKKLNYTEPISFHFTDRNFKTPWFHFIENPSSIRKFVTPWLGFQLPFLLADTVSDLRVSYWWWKLETSPFFTFRATSYVSRY